MLGWSTTFGGCYILIELGEGALQVLGESIDIGFVEVTMFVRVQPRTNTLSEVDDYVGDCDDGNIGFPTQHIFVGECSS